MERGGAAGGARFGILVKEVMIIRENALDKLDSKCFMKVVELQGLWALAIAKKTQVLEDGECATRGMSQRLGCFIWQCNRLELIGVEQTTIFLNSLSTTKITSWSRVAAVFDHTTAALDINKQPPVNCREIGDEGVLVWSISSCTPTPCTMKSIIVYLTAGSAESKMAQRVIRRWREPGRS